MIVLEDIVNRKGALKWNQILCTTVHPYICTQIISLNLYSSKNIYKCYSKYTFGRFIIESLYKIHLL